MKASKNQIPDPLWEEMVDFYGYEKAYKIAQKHVNSLHALTLKLLNDKFKKLFGISLFLLILIVMGILYFIFSFVA
jgi:hypothetical protein